MAETPKTSSMGAQRLSGVPDDIALGAITKAPMAMVLTNPNLPDNPIVYVNRAFETVTGYSAEAAIGRNCRFLQRGAADEASLQDLRAAIAERREITVDLHNRRADGSAFWNRLMIAPLHDPDGALAYFLGVQLALDAPPRAKGEARLDVALKEIQHRVKNHLAMIIGMIRLQAREAEGAAGDFDTLARRIEALQLLYEELMDRGQGNQANDDDVALGAYLTRVANAIAYLDGRSGVRVNIDADAITVPFDTATQVGLILSEILTNTMQHAFTARESGLVEVRIKELSGGVIRLQVADDGVGLPAEVDWPNEGNLGGQIVRQLVGGLDAKLAVERGATGTSILLDVPAVPR
jgi:PAS domain S-box-containing protein